ncbi:hypothetical protein [Helicobacter sp. T3_23-1059]
MGLDFGGGFMVVFRFCTQNLKTIKSKIYEKSPKKAQAKKTKKREN